MAGDVVSKIKTEIVILHRQATWDDVYYIADNMREEDQDECRAGGLTPLDALSLSFDGSQVAYTLFEPVSLVPAAVLGVSHGALGPGFGNVWMLGTDGIRKHKFAFLRRCKPFVDSLFEETGYDALYNYTYVENKLHHAWLKWLGFKFIREVELPPYGHCFYEFVRLR
jgi:hypothetical protein